MNRNGFRFYVIFDTEHFKSPPKGLEVKYLFYLTVVFFIKSYNVYIEAAVPEVQMNFARKLLSYFLPKIDFLPEKLLL